MFHGDLSFLKGIVGQCPHPVTGLWCSCNRYASENCPVRYCVKLGFVWLPAHQKQRMSLRGGRSPTWQSPQDSGNLGGLPRQCAHWLAMTCVIFETPSHRQIPICVSLPYAERKLATGRAVSARLTARKIRRLELSAVTRRQIPIYFLVLGAGFWPGFAVLRSLPRYI